MAIGNPYEPAGPFFEACKLGTWHVIPISVYDTPNFTGEPVPEKAQTDLHLTVAGKDRPVPFEDEQTYRLAVDGGVVGDEMLEGTP